MCKLQLHKDPVFSYINFHLWQHYALLNSVFRTTNCSYSQDMLCWAKLHMQLSFFYDFLTWIGFVISPCADSLSAILPESINIHGTVMTKMARVKKKPTYIFLPYKLCTLYYINQSCGWVSGVHQFIIDGSVLVTEIMSLLDRYWKYVLIWQPDRKSVV